MLEVLFLNCGMEFSQRKDRRAYNPNTIPLGINRCCASVASPPEVDSHVDELESAGTYYQAADSRLVLSFLCAVVVRLRYIVLLRCQTSGIETN